MRKVYVVISEDASIKERKLTEVIAVYSSLKRAENLCKIHNGKYEDWTYRIQTEVIR